jgi:hypothetical protein
MHLPVLAVSTLTLALIALLDDFGLLGTLNIGEHRRCFLVVALQRPVGLVTTKEAFPPLLCDCCWDLLWTNVKCFTESLYWRGEDGLMVSKPH